MNEDNLDDLIHKTKSSLTSIIGYSELLFKKLSNKNETLRESEWAKNLNSEALRIKALLEKISKNL